MNCITATTKKAKQLMQWYNEPPQWNAQDDQLMVSVGAKTDYWRKTHYGFIRDNGHFYYERVYGDFTLDVKVSGHYDALYDQAGVMVRLDETTWFKTGIEYMEGVQNASAVITRDYSDWSIVPLGSNPASIWLRVTRQGDSFEIHYSLDGSSYTMLRMFYLASSAYFDVGLMCAAPDGEGFQVTFEGLKITRTS
jgi:uncharacterized protein